MPSACSAAPCCCSPSSSSGPRHEGGESTPVLLTFTVFVPLAGALALLAIPGERQRLARWVALAFSLAAFGLAVALAVRFEVGRDGFQLGVTADWVRSLGVRFRLGVDGVSLPLVLLTTVLTPLAIVGSWRMRQRPRAYLALLLVLESALLGVFVALDLFLFYIFWEVVLVPSYFLVGIWGGPRRVAAAVKFFVYTLLGGLLMLVGIVSLAYLHAKATGSASFDYETLRDLAGPGHAALAVPGLLRRLRDQDAAGPAAQLAAGHLRAGPDHHHRAAGRSDVEDGRLRASALRAAAVPGRRPLVPAAAADAGGHQHPLQRSGRHRSARLQAAGRLLVGVTPRLHRHRHLRLHRAGAAGRGVLHGGPRPAHRRAVLRHRHAVGPPRHLGDRRARRPAAGGAPHGRSDAGHHPRRGGAARHGRLRRRVPHAARRLPDASRLRGAGRARRDPRRGLHALGLPADVAWDPDQRGEPCRRRPRRARVGDHGAAAGRDHRVGDLPAPAARADRAGGPAGRPDHRRGGRPARRQRPGGRQYQPVDTVTARGAAPGPDGGARAPAGPDR